MYQRVCIYIVVLFCMAGFISVQQATAGVAEQDSLALVALYNSTNGDEWTNNDNWLTGPVNTWYGVTVSDGRVIELSLKENNLEGDLPTEIGNLTHVEKIYLTDNSLSEAIPTQIGDLVNLTTLYLNRNDLSGSIPAEIGDLTNLSTLMLYSNELSGKIPDEIGNLVNLTNLQIYNNNLSGAIPPEIGNLEKLWWLSLFDNELSGSIPAEIGNLSNLSSLGLSRNELSGSIPPEIGNLNNLRQCVLAENELSGTVPTEFRNLTLLESITLYANHFTELPDLSSMENLNRLDVTSNQLTFEDIEPNIGIENFEYAPQDDVGAKKDTTVELDSRLELSVDVGGSHNQYQWFKNGELVAGATESAYVIESVQVPDAGRYTCKITNTVATELTLYSRPIDVGIEGHNLEADSLALVALYNSTNGDEWTNNDNWLSGPLDTWNGIAVSADGRVSRVSLINNNLQGSIPAEIGKLGQLSRLYLSRNQLSGSIPLEISNLVSLKILWLMHNELTGTIPPEISNLSQLTSLHLGFNELSGTIPSEIYNLTNLTYLYLSRNNLSGNISPQIGDLTHLRTLHLSGNEFTGTIPSEIFELDSLRSLRLYYNQLEGGLSADIAQLTNLYDLWLYANQFTGALPAELGQLSNLQYLFLQSNQFTGAVPNTFCELLQLKKLRLSENMFIDLPDLSPDTALVELHVENNRFTFEDIEPNMGIEDFDYAPQDSIGEEQDTTLAEGESLELSVEVSGTANEYQWFKNGVEISGAESNTYTIAAAAADDAGDYCCHITNTIATELTIYSRLVHVSVDTDTKTEETEQIPDKFALYQNFPNPFNASTTIEYDLPQMTFVCLELFNLFGQKITTLVNEEQKAGHQSVVWNGSSQHGEKTSSGLYIYRLRTETSVQSKKMILLE